MSTQNSLVQFGNVSKMLDHDPDAIKEFSEAAQESFTTFREEFQRHLNNRDMEGLKKVGHRIKPIAQMLGAEQLIETYYEAKDVLRTGDQNAIDACIEKINRMCDQIIDEFKEKINTLNY